MNMYINPANNDAVFLNEIMFDNYVFDGENYVFPFQDGTTCYYDSNRMPWIVTDLLTFASTDANLSQADRDFISAILATALTYAQAVAAGWLPPPTDD
jgi:hypothetical protein